MTFENRRIVSLMLRSLCILTLLAMAGCDDDDRDPVPILEEIEYDFVADREFPPDSNDRESLREFEFTKAGITLLVTAEDGDGMPVAVSRRGPGGFGVVGNGGLEPDGGTTSGNRINNGEWLVVEILDDDGELVSAQLVGVTFSRIKQFPDHPETGFEIIADNGGTFWLEVEGTLDPASDEFEGIEDEDGNVVIDVEDSRLFGHTFIFTNGRPLHPTANRFRVGGITILVER